MNQDLLTYFAWFVIAVLMLAVVVFIVWLGSQPGKIARSRNHPQAEAIEACSWIGLLFGGIGWAFALVWAFTKPVVPRFSTDAANLPTVDPAELGKLKERIQVLEGQLAQVSKPKESVG